MAESTDAELRERFASANADIEPDVLAELHSIMRLHSIDAQELWYKWESYSMKMGTEELTLDIKTARALKDNVQDTLERENRSKAHLLSSNKRGGATPRNAGKMSNTDVFGM
jgi:DNA polymerase alpha subunit B